MNIYCVPPDAHLFWSIFFAVTDPADKLDINGLLATENNLMVVDADCNAIFIYLLFPLRCVRARGGQT